MGHFLVATETKEVVKVKRKFGGAQPGAGRPKGSLTLRQKARRQVREEHFIPGKTPLDLMIKNMRDFDKEGDHLYNDLLAMLMDHKPGANATPEEVREHVSQVMVLLAKKRECKLDAQKCASDAAPFINPRLSAIAHIVKNETVNRKPEDEMTEEQRLDYF